ncbi:CinA family nicotinamide mononucleotide deamidase-related protein [Vulgatibacter sp.]|uniref:CinA family nicotinamide mononucleotide deamidase-related protein n=1 Tax=Vulgatibacter sp. TaxID=1971226 RepID=UPI003565468A
MHIELITTGDELVSGQIVDTNSPWLMDRLFAAGELVRRKLAIGDEFEDIVSALREAASRADLVIVSGGLGPTLDDMTVDAACKAFGHEPVVDEAQLARIAAIFTRIDRPLTPNNERQARVPAGAEVLGNDFGTATAFVLHERERQCELFFLPGVPRELKGLCEKHLFPRLKARAAAAGVHRCYRAVKCYGIPESHMDQAVRPLLERHPHVRYGTRTSFPENHVKLLAEGATPQEAQARCEALEVEVRKALGRAVYGGAEDTFAGATLQALRGRGWRVCFAESLTAGLAASLLADAPGASDVLLGSSVTYATGLKERWLGVPHELIEREGAVSEACARAMAEGALVASGADVAVSLTGYAGPEGGEEGRPAGTVFAAVAGGGLPTKVVERRMPFDRNQVRRGAAYMALELLRRRALGLERE